MVQTIQVLYIFIHVCFAKFCFARQLLFVSSHIVVIYLGSISFPRSFSGFNYSILFLWISHMFISTCVPDFVCVECTPQKFLVKG